MIQISNFPRIIEMVSGRQDPEKGALRVSLPESSYPHQNPRLVSHNCENTCAENTFPPKLAHTVSGLSLDISRSDTNNGDQKDSFFTYTNTRT